MHKLKDDFIRSKAQATAARYLAEKRHKKEAALASVIDYLKLAAGSLALLTLINWFIIGVFNAY